MYDKPFWNTVTIIVLVVALLIQGIYIFYRYEDGLINRILDWLRDNTLVGELFEWYKKKRRITGLKKSYGFIDEHEEWLNSKDGDQKSNRIDKLTEDSATPEVSQSGISSESKKESEQVEASATPEVRESGISSESKKGTEHAKGSESSIVSRLHTGNEFLNSWSSSDEAKSILQDKLHLFQKLNYHRVVEEMGRQITIVFCFLVIVSGACIYLPIHYYNSPTLEPEANREYGLFIHQIDSLHDEAGMWGDSRINDTSRAALLIRQDTPDKSIFRQKAMDAKFAAISEFSSGYMSFLFIKQALIRFVTIIFLFTILAYLLRMYRRLWDKRTRFRQLEEATTITLFYLFKKVTRAKTTFEEDEAILIRENLPKMIDKLYDFSVIEPAKGGRDDERINSTISEMNKAITDVYKMIADLQQSAKPNAK